MKPGATFPDFSLQNQDGKPRRLSDYAGRWLVLYVYPKDDTPGCTVQATSFTKTKDEFERAGISVVGLSQDDVASHKAFCNKFSLAIDLLADPEHKLLSAAGVERKPSGSWMRTTFVVDPKGTLRKVYEQVAPEGHERLILNDVVALQRG